MKNDYQIGDLRISIPPTLLFSTLGKIDDVRKAVTMDVKKPGDLVYILGKTYKELGGSEWYAQNGAIGNSVPQVRPETAKALYEALHQAIKAGLVASCHDCSDGGLGGGPGRDGLRRRPGAYDRPWGDPDGREAPERRSPLFRIPEPLCRHRGAEEQRGLRGGSLPAPTSPRSARSLPKRCSASTTEAESGSSLRIWRS